jgi:CheY-like chemotaxis protein
LLLADDSAAVQKVIELTFADEGMEVVSVGDGQTALQRLESLIPDVVLADAFMPGLNGYELCRSMKDDARFSQIPVMLLVSSFAPFDEAEAQRAGADDVITKPFQSIRQLVSRVGLLLNDKESPADDMNDQSAERFQVEPEAPPIPVQVESDEPHVTVLVEAAQMESPHPHEETGGACAPDIEFQTADTARLEPGAHSHTDEYDTLEIVPAPSDVRTGEQMLEQTPPAVMSDTSMNPTVKEPVRPRFSDALLDLDDSEFTASAIVDDVVLDLDLETPAPAPVENRSWELAPGQPAEVVEPQEEPVAEVQAVSPEVSEEPKVSDEATAEREVHSLEAENAATGPLEYPSAADAGQPELSADAINAIARRVIEQMSDKVVREIAWEVVPELSELMIKKKLDQG